MSEQFIPLEQYPIRRDPPLPLLEKPDPITWFDLSPEDRAKVIIDTSSQYARKWKFPDED